MLFRSNAYVIDVDYATLIGSVEMGTEVFCIDHRDGFIRAFVDERINILYFINNGFNEVYVGKSSRSFHARYACISTGLALTLRKFSIIICSAKDKVVADDDDEKTAKRLLNYGVHINNIRGVQSFNMNGERSGMRADLEHFSAWGRYNEHNDQWTAISGLMSLSKRFESLRYNPLGKERIRKSLSTRGYKVKIRKGVKMNIGYLIKIK